MRLLWLLISTTSINFKLYLFIYLYIYIYISARWWNSEHDASSYLGRTCTAMMSLENGQSISMRLNTLLWANQAFVFPIVTRWLMADVHQIHGVKSEWLKLSYILFPQITFRSWTMRTWWSWPGGGGAEGEVCGVADGNVPPSFWAGRILFLRKELLSLFFFFSSFL